MKMLSSPEFVPFTPAGVAPKPSADTATASAGGSDRLPGLPLPDLASAHGRGAATRSGQTEPKVFDLAVAASIPEHLLTKARQDAKSAGYATGWAHGIQAARDIARRLAERTEQEQAAAETVRAGQISQAVAALDTAAGRLERLSVPSAEQLESVIVTSAFTLAEAIIAARLADDTVRGRDALTRALALAPQGEPVTVHLNPDDHHVITTTAPTAASDLGRTVTLVPDASLAPGDATAECAATNVDARIETALARAREALGL